MQRRRCRTRTRARLQRDRRPPAVCERLESRHALAVGYDGGTWSIRGDDVPSRPDDTILIDRDPADASQLRATVNGVVVDCRVELQVGTIRISGGRGDDTISVLVPGNTRIETVLEGGFGNDTIRGGDGRDTIFGGPGQDALNGGKGDDSIRGNGGQDSLVGSVGDDTLLGGAGADTIRGGGGRNALDGGLGIDTFFGKRNVDAVKMDDGETLRTNESTNPLRSLDDLSRLKSWYLDTAVAQWSGRLGQAAWEWGPIVPLAGTTAAPLSTPATPQDHSTTNNQVAGVDEGDRVQTDGERLFLLAGEGVDILRATPVERLERIGHVAIPGWERALFLHGTRLTVISEESGWSHQVAEGQTHGGLAWWPGMAQPAQPVVIVTVVDVTNPAAATIVESTRLDGWFVDARAIEDRVVVVTQDGFDIPAPALLPLPVVLPLTKDTRALPGVATTVWCMPWPGGGQRYAYEDEVSYRRRLEEAWNEGAIPGFSVTDAAGTTTPGSLAQVGHTSCPVVVGDNSLLSVSSFTIDDGVAGPDAVTSVAGVRGSVYASSSSLYVYASNWGSWWDVADAGATTNIYQFDLRAAEMPLVAMGAVAGTTINQFSLDETPDGLLRVATTRGLGATPSSGVTVLAAVGGSLESVGSIAGLAPGERIYSVRFVGDRGYLCTFRQVDPLFVIDLSSPTTPRVTGELKVPGYSTHLQPLDDTHLLGVGRDVDPDTGRDNGLQLSIFDVGDPAAPKRSASFRFGGDWGSWSPALWDHHALGWFAAQGILALPVQVAGHGTSLAVFRVDPTAADGLTKIGEIQHEDPIERSVRIAAVVYAISSGRVTAHPIDDPAVILAAADLTAGREQPILVGW